MCEVQTIKINHHIMHLLVGFIGDPTGQLNTSANSGELTTARALQVYMQQHKDPLKFYAESIELGVKDNFYGWDTVTTQVLIQKDYGVEDYINCSTATSDCSILMLILIFLVKVVTRYITLH